MMRVISCTMECVGSNKVAGSVRRSAPCGAKAGTSLLLATVLRRPPGRDWRCLRGQAAAMCCLPPGCCATLSTAAVSVVARSSTINRHAHKFEGCTVGRGVLSA